MIALYNKKIKSQMHGDYSSPYFPQLLAQKIVIESYYRPENCDQ